MSVLVQAELDGVGLEEHEIVMGFFLLVAAGNDSTKATYSSGMRALLEDRGQLQLLLDDPTLIPSAVEESLRMFPAFAHFRRTATRDAELGGQRIREGDKVVMWYVSSNRDETRYDDPDRFDVTRNPELEAAVRLVERVAQQVAQRPEPVARRLRVHVQGAGDRRRVAAALHVG